ncbi:interleukin-7 receptor subunit alpha [Megalops cyprinoides]|uniref:interleukin-7 receptor subunit alpha n=1 Tax=Megalops cyprinoides TaxID=118141 RepID=UPI0018641547|nr:interleukin-7 receptor subunit alpha [Megalops cyprinoides]
MQQREMAYWPWVLFLPLVAQAESGGGDYECNVSCFSHLNVKEHGTLTCQLENESIDEVTNITLCVNNRGRSPCHDGERKGNIITFNSLTAISEYELVICFASMEKYHSRFHLKDIIKPMPPWIVNATFSESSNAAAIHIGTPYEGDYLGGKLKFQVKIEGPDKHLERAISYQSLTIEGAYLKMNTMYFVKVRAIPNGEYFKGTWSEWSPYKSFKTPALKERDASLLIYILLACLLILLLIIVTALLRWHKVIKSSIWPSIPNPKNTLLQMYKPNRGLPVSFNPEAFSDRNIHMVDHVEAKPSAPELMEAWDSYEVRHQSQECGGLEGFLWNSADNHRESSPMLSRSTQDGEDMVGGTPKQGLLDGSEVVYGGSNDGVKSLPLPQTGRREEAYVTMSSFLKTQ